MTEDQNVNDDEQTGEDAYKFPTRDEQTCFKKTPYMRMFVIGTIVLAVLVTFVVLGVVIYFQAPSADVMNEPVVEEVARVVDAAGPGYAQGLARFDSLEDYFRDANPQLFGRLESAMAAQAAGEKTRGATYIAGVGGVGKSFLIGKLDLPEKATSQKIKLADVFKETKTDLQTVDGTRVFNELPWAAEVSIQKLLADHDATGKAFVLVDDLDEIHPETALEVLRGIEAYLKKKGSFIHFIVMGRPEAFWPWINNENRVVSAGISQSPMILVGPDYQTLGDLEFRCRDYLAWKYSDISPANADEVAAAFVKRMQAYPFLHETIRPLFGGNVVIDEVVAWVVDHKAIAQGAQAIQANMVQLLFERNTGSHNRPSWNDEVYAGLMGEAAKFAAKTQVDGWIEVSDGDAVEYEDAVGMKWKVGLADLLKHSGFVFLDAGWKGKGDSTRYRFSPQWVGQRLIVKTYVPQ